MTAFFRWNTVFHVKNNDFARAREAAGIGFREASRRLNVAISTLWKWEAGKGQPPADVVGRMADLYGCSTDFLLGREGTAPLRQETDPKPDGAGAA